MADASEDDTHIADGEGMSGEGGAEQDAPAPADPTDPADPDADPDPDGDPDPDIPSPRGLHGLRAKYPALARVLAWGTSVVAAGLVFVALLLPSSLPALTPEAFLHLPVEAVCGAAVLLVLPRKARWVAAALAGVGLGALVIVKLLDMGFNETLGRGFNLVLDWPLLDDGLSFLEDSIGESSATWVVVGAVVLVLALLVLMTLSVLRLGGLMARHSVVATRTVLALGTVWVLCAALGLQSAGGTFATRSTAGLVHDRYKAVKATLKDERKFAEEARVDAFRDVPDDRLLTGLRGKDVMFTFIESYGRSAIENPESAQGVGEELAKGTERLRKAGFSARSAWLTSATYGGSSWLGHSTFLSGLWIDNQQRYRTVTAGDHMTLTSAFKRTGAWRTVGIMPGVTKDWPEGKFYGLDHVYDSRELGYKGPKFSWSTMPDQYTLKAFERLEHGKPGDKPLMSEIILTSSHNPWAPLPRTLGWNEIGDGSVYGPIEKAGKDPVEVWKDTSKVRREYGRSIQYSVHNLISYVEKYGSKDTVLVFLGDHQPVPKVSGENANRDVPVAIIAHDKKVLDRISGWGWHEGLNPGAGKAPVWKMDSFRDRFLTAYGPQPDAAPSPSKR
ncbi:sulfatase [Streptomyces sp. NPDC048639]|uniref:sulfatase n=1 Tax=Streptomyces sp. NPDC048639 TaxID=3365581 RepID=UPI0037112838